MIKILDKDYKRLGVIKNAIDSTRLESINGANTLDYKAVLDSKLSTLINENSMYEIDDDYFDTATFVSSSNEDDTYTIQVESEHISYRLNNPEYNIDYFAEEGTPTVILGKILEGTGFSVGSVEYTTDTVYYAQEAKSRRQILMDFTDQLGGELVFNKLEISIVKHRGSTAIKPVLKDRNVRILSKSVNKRSLDDNDNPTVSYECTPIYMPGDSYALGDDVILINKELNINEKLRVVELSTNPYDEEYTTLKFSNSSESIASSLYQIANSSVLKDKTYNGIKIGPEYGFEAIRNDKKARAYFRSDGMSFQSGDGSGENWKDRLYYEYDQESDTTKLVFDGEFSTASIEAIKAHIDIVASNTIITNTLYAQKGVIAELTVDELNTSNKVDRYFNHNTSPIKYIKISNEHIEGEDKSVIQFITGVTDGTVEQATNRYGLPVFWADGEFAGITMTVTEWPVYQYKYVETVTSLIDEDPIVTGVNIMDDNISITYSDGSVHGYTIIKDEDGHVTSIGDINIGYGGDTTAPNFVSATTTTDGTEIIISFDKPIADPTGKQAEFLITNNAASAPALLSATTNVEGTMVILTFDKSMMDVSGKQSEFGVSSLSEMTNQQWSSGYPQSPDPLSTHPYQCIINTICT